MSAEIPRVVRAYFGRRRNPIIVQTFRPGGQGWVDYPVRRAVVTNDRVRLLAREGITAVALRVGKRTADFSIPELLRDDPWPVGSAVDTIRPTIGRGA